MRTNLISQSYELQPLIPTRNFARLTSVNVTLFAVNKPNIGPYCCSANTWGESLSIIITKKERGVNPGLCKEVWVN